MKIDKIYKIGSFFASIFWGLYINSAKVFFGNETFRQDVFGQRFSGKKN